MRLFQINPQRAFTLIEVLIAFIILSMALLGAMALQVKAKQASFDSIQRTAAVALGNDIIERIRVNDHPQIVSLYKQTITSEGTLKPSSTCFSNSCNAEQIVLLDIQQWQRAIQARENTGLLDNATLCINPILIGNVFNVEIIISWQGRQAFNATNKANEISCGDTGEKRRLVVFSSYIYPRG